MSIKSDRASESSKRFAERLKRLRAMHGWNQQLAAEKCGMKQASYSDIESCNKRVDIDKLVLLAKVYQVTVGFLVEGTFEGVSEEQQKQINESVLWLRM